MTGPVTVDQVPDDQVPDDLVDAVIADQQTALTGPSTFDGVALVAGAGVKVTVSYGQLVVTDGIGETRRCRRFARVATGTDTRLTRLVVEADTGYVTLDALGWCQDTGVTVVGVDRDGQPAWASLVRGPSDARITRALAAAGASPTDPVGVAITVGLLRAKLAGQQQIVAGRLGHPEMAATFESLLVAVDLASSVSEARQIEASGAALYWSAWTAPRADAVTAPRFARSVQTKVPPGWGTYPGRRSLHGAEAANRRATHPTNAILNYCHTIARGEAVRALNLLGLDPSLGILHADMARRDSLACDLQEAIRPTVEGYVLDLLTARTFTRGDFLETPTGDVRLGMRLRAELAGTAPRWGREIAPHAETLRATLTRAVTATGTARSVPLGASPLTGAARKAAASDVAARKAAANREAMRAVRAGERAPVTQPSLWTCPDCGAPVPGARSVRCQACVDTDPAQSAAIRASRAAAISSRRRREAGWSAHHPAGPLDPSWWEQTCRPALAEVPLPTIVAACGVAKSTASGWRSGRNVAHPMHWSTLAGLVGVPEPPVTPPPTTTP